MAQFKIDLLTPRYDNIMSYLLTNITSYQQAQHHREKILYTDTDNFKFNFDYNEIYNVTGSYMSTQRDLETQEEKNNFVTQIKLASVLYQGQDIIFELTPKSNTFITIEYDVKSNYNYSYNEKFSIHANAQKDLSFEMDRYIIYNDMRMENPFINALHIGTQILLTDKYEQQHIMTVKDIKFKINSANITYTYTCEDSFHYQLTHQQTTYSIVNDPVTVDFIGAKTLDYGATKIARDCFISYEFIPFNKSLYKLYKYITDENGTTIKQEKFSSVVESEYNVELVIKPSYTDDFFNQTISFSSSATNPLATLIALGQELDCQIGIYEYIDINGQLFNYFGLEPIKKNNPTGLKYSPDIDIQNFNLEYSGDNFATVLNVEPCTNNDEVISMLPEVPSIFLSYFTNDDGKTSKYTDSMFLDFVDGDLYDGQAPVETVSLKLIDNTSKTFYGSKIITKNRDFKTYYPFIRFDYNKQYSTLGPNMTSHEINFVCLVPQLDPRIKVVTSIPTEQDINIDYIEYNNEYNNEYYEGNDQHHRYEIIADKNTMIRYNIVKDQAEIPFNLIDPDQPGYFGAFILDGAIEEESTAHGYIKNYRHVSEEEKLFATIADQCPGLENRLIDLNYLTNNKVISPYARDQLLDLLRNDLRIVNGQLLATSAAYFTALHKQTKTIANITQAIDHLSAVMHADIVAPYAATATPLTYDTLEKAYNELYALNSTDDKTALFGYKKILNDYLNKDFKAEQRFLRAIKDFTDFFNDKNSLTLNGNQIIQNTLKIVADTESESKYSFNINSEFRTIYEGDESTKTIISHLLTDNKFNTDIYQFRDNNYYKLPIPLVTPTEYYIPSLQKDTIVPCEETEYNPNQEYFLTNDQYLKIFGGVEIPANKITVSNPDDATIYIPLTKNEIRKLVLGKHPNQYYSRIQNYYIPFDGIRYSSAEKAFQGIEPKIINTANQAIDKYDPEDFGNIYINNLDVDTLYYYGPLYKKISHDGQDYFERYNEKGYSKSEYDEKNKAANKDPNFSIGQDPDTYNTFQSIPYVHNIPVAAKAALKSGDFDAYIKLTTKQKESFPYYAFVQNPDQATHARNLSIAGDVLTPLFFIPDLRGVEASIGTSYGILQAQAKLEENCRGVQQYTPYRKFEPTVTKENEGLKFKHKDDEAGKGNSINAIFARNAISADNCAQYTNIGGKQQTSPTFDDTGWEQNRFYFNYYGLIVATYSLGYDKNRDTLQGQIDENGKQINLTIPAYNANNYTDQYKLGLKNPGFYSILTKDQLLNTTDQYYCLVLGYSGDNKNQIDGTFFAHDEQGNYQGPSFNKGDNSTPLRFNAAQYSNIIQNALNPLDLNQVPADQGDQQTLKIAQYYTSITTLSTHSTNPIINTLKNIVFETYLNDQLGTMYFLILRYEPYEYAQITQESTQHINGDNYYLNYKECDTHNVYDRNTDLRINLLNYFNPSEFDQPIIYTRQLIDDNFQKVTNFDQNQLYYYYDSDGTYHRTYTMQQINTSKPNLYYQPYDQYVSIDLQDSTKKGIFRVPLYKHNIISTDNEVQEEIIDLGVQILDFDKATKIEPNIYKFNLYNELGQSFVLTVTLEQDELEVVAPMSNGSFGYKFRNKTEGHTIFTQCMMIETQLTSAGERAVSASKGCQFFLPDSGLPKENETDNQFFHEIIDVLDNDKVQLSSKFLPKVEIYSAQYQGKEQTILPNYRLHFAEKEVTDIEGIEPTIRLFTIENSIFKDNSVVLNNLCNDLKIKLSDLFFEEQGTTTYYYTTSGGTTGSKLPLQMQNRSTQYELLSGWNGIAFQLIQLRYTDAAIPEYESLQKEKYDTWKKIYTLYPNVLVEHDYKNEHALTSKELFDAAQLYFKDQKHPEERYTLSLIDVQSLQGYHGQPLQIGDAIQLDADAIYDGYDDLYHSLNKFLFITDISYDLRKDDNMSVTVNTIKYQEKLLQQLVSLIR